MASLFVELLKSTVSLPEPFLLLVVGALLLAFSGGLRRSVVSHPHPTQAQIVRRRIGSARHLTAQQGHS